jgi:hypothetical protein
VNNSHPKHTLELGIEFLAELVLFAFPYGAEEMGLPHNFWLGLVCWVAGIAIAIRMFWIFPVWEHRLTRLEKGLIAFILLGGFVAIFYKPVLTAYGKRNSEASKFSKTPSPTPIYIPQRNDYSCPDGWTPAGSWGPNGKPDDPYRPIGCKPDPEQR